MRFVLRFVSGCKSRVIADTRWGDIRGAEVTKQQTICSVSSSTIARLGIWHDETAIGRSKVRLDGHSGLRCVVLRRYEMYGSGVEDDLASPRLGLTGDAKLPTRT